MSPLMEDSLDLLIWSIPFTALFVLLDLLIQHQYAIQPTLVQEMGRAVYAVPVLVVVIWLTTVRPVLPPRGMQFLFFAAAGFCGSSFLWVFSLVSGRVE